MTNKAKIAMAVAIVGTGLGTYHIGNIVGYDNGLNDGKTSTVENIKRQPQQQCIDGKIFTAQLNNNGSIDVIKQTGACYLDEVESGFSRNGVKATNFVTMVFDECADGMRVRSYRHSRGGAAELGGSCAEVGKPNNPNL